MLEIRDIRKTYQTKKGTPTRALDGVSLTFPARGLVFILGKSGSGKSTLLNICGGLDRPDEGEIVVRGRSSKDFSAEDFDSYRNTCVGFVFQEYNVLDEFSVEDNVALALELQNKPRDAQRIARILRDVELEGFAKRRPNTLSGGQKQRVAIARALVKDPQIILADEPTGALDSETGRQVLDTLQKLSADKLVIVVSHDREFAEQYADRIVELQDGKVVSDVTRTGEGCGANVRFCEDTVSVRDCARLTEEDFASIRRFLSASKGGAAISCSRQAVAAAQERTPRAGGQFEKTATAQDPRGKSAPDGAAADDAESGQALIRSHMPFRHAFRMGASCVRLRPLRLTFTILLSVLAFTLFGLFSTLAFYDPVATAARAELLSYGVYAAGFVSPAFYDAHSADFLARDGSIRPSQYFSFELSGGALSIGAADGGADGEELDAPSALAYLPIRYGRSPAFAFFDEGTGSLRDEEIVLPFRSLLPQVQAMAEAERAAIAQREGEGAAQAFAADMERDLDFVAEGSHLFLEKDEETGEILSSERVYADDAQMQAARDAVLELIERYEGTEYALGRTYALRSSVGTALGEYRLAGFTYGTVSYSQNAAYFSESSCLSVAQSCGLNTSLNSTEITSYTFPADARYNGCAVALPTDEGALRELLRAAGQAGADDTFFTVGTPLAYDLESIHHTVEVLSGVFLALGVVMALLAMLLLFNFISVSILDKKREIGILRALGARSADVFKIFYSESAIIAGLCFLLSMLACFLVCAVLNATLAGVLRVSAFVFGPLSWLVMLGIALVTSLAATFLPVYGIAKRSPVESIRAL